MKTEVNVMIEEQRVVVRVMGHTSVWRGSKVRETSSCFKKDERKR